MIKILSQLGLCMKAGCLVAGEYMVEKVIKNGSACLVIIAEDASNNTKKKFINMCQYRNIEFIEFSDKSTLGHALGKDIRATIGICDEGFKKSILSKINAQ